MTTTTPASSPASSSAHPGSPNRRPRPSRRRRGDALRPRVGSSRDPFESADEEVRPDDDSLAALFNITSPFGYDAKDVSEDALLAETRLGRAAMLGFFFTTLGDVATRGEGPLEQLRDEERYLVNHVNPVTLLQDALALGGIYVETVFIAWVCLACAFLLAVQRGLADPVRTYSGGAGTKRDQKAKSEKQFEAVVSSLKEAVDDVVKEQEPYERFNGRLAMVGFALACVGDVGSGGLGPLEQLDLETGIPVIDAELFGAFFLFGVFFNVVATGATVGTRAWRKGKSVV